MTQFFFVDFRVVTPLGGVPECPHLKNWFGLWKYRSKPLFMQKISFLSQLEWTRPPSPSYSLWTTPLKSKNLHPPAVVHEDVLLGVQGGVPDEKRFTVLLFVEYIFITVFCVRTAIVRAAVRLWQSWYGDGCFWTSIRWVDKTAYSLHITGKVIRL